jgi:hypothetical protein
LTRTSSENDGIGDDHRRESTNAYDPPVITVLGTVHSLTLGGFDDKKFGWSDGWWLFLADRVTQTSP